MRHFELQNDGITFQTNIKKHIHYGGSISGSPRFNKAKVWPKIVQSASHTLRELPCGWIAAKDMSKGQGLCRIKVTQKSTLLTKAFLWVRKESWCKKLAGLNRKTDYSFVLAIVKLRNSRRIRLKNWNTKLCQPLYSMKFLFLVHQTSQDVRRSWTPQNLSFQYISFHEKNHLLILAGSAFYQIWSGRLLP